MNKLPLVSIIIPVKNEGKNVRTTLDSLSQAKTEFPFEIVVVDDGSTDGCCRFLTSPGDMVFEGHALLVRTEGIGAAAARNLGASRAKGEYLIFCDAHLLFEDLWIDRLLEPLLTGKADATTPGIALMERPHVVGYGQTLDERLNVRWNAWREEPFPTAVLPGGCLAVSRRVFQDLGGFDRGMKVWGYEDVEFSLKLWLFGYTGSVQPRTKVLHLFRKQHPYRVTWDHVYYNLLRMAYSHFKRERIDRCKRLIRYADVPGLVSALEASDVLAQRRAYFQRRQFDDEWFMRTFHIPF